MARSLTGREKFAVAVLIVIVAGGLWFIMHREGGLFGSGAPAAVAEGELPGEAPVLAKDLLAHDAEVYDPGGRDLFKYYTPPPPPEPVRPPPPPPPPPPTPVVKPRPPGPPPEPAPPKPDFAYIGYLGPQNRKIAVFERGDEIFDHQQGEVIDGRFKLEQFGYRSVVLAYLEPRWAGKTTELHMDKGRR